MSRTPREAEHPVCASVRKIRLEVGVTQVELALRLEIPQTYVSKWEIDRLPTVDQIAAIEDALKVPRGTVLRDAGYIFASDTMPTVEQVIRLDQSLSTPERHALLEVVAAFRRPPQAEPRRRRRSL